MAAAGDPPPHSAALTAVMAVEGLMVAAAL
jgi:hypothetical protein